MYALQLLQSIRTHPLSRGLGMASVFRFFSWQVRSRLARAPIIHEWVGGSRFYASKGETGLTGNIYNGLAEFPDMGFLLHFLRRDDCFVDVGANVGAYSILAGATAGASGIAFEPVPETYIRLRKNMQLNDLGARVTCVNQALGATEGVIEFTSKRDTTNRALLAGETDRDSIEVPVTTLNAALRGRNPLLMKIDVEGFEVPVLDGGAEVLANSDLRAVIIEINGSGDKYGFDDRRIIRSMEFHGFAPYSYNPIARKLTALSGANNKQGNTLFLRDIDFVAERIKQAPQIDVVGCQF